MADGFFLGGIAQGMETARRGALEEKTQADSTGIATRGLELQERIQGRAEQQQDITRGDAFIAETMTAISETIKSSIAGGNPKEAIMPVIQPYIVSAKELAARIGRNPAEIDGKVATLFAQSTPVQQAAVKGAATATELVSEARTKNAALAPPGMVRGGAPVVIPGTVPGVPAVPGTTAPAAPAPLTEGDLLRWKSPQDKLADADQLREKYTAQSKDFITIRDAKNRIDVLKKTGPGDVGLVFQYLKILDPNSTVREGEFATVRNAGGVPSALRSLINKAIGEGVLEESIRKQIEEQATAFYQKAAVQHDKLVTQYANVAKKRGHAVEDVVFDLYPAAVSGAPLRSGTTPGGVNWKIK